MKQRLLAFILAISMIFAALPMPVHAAGADAGGGMSDLENSSDTAMMGDEGEEPGEEAGGELLQAAILEEVDGLSISVDTRPLLQGLEVSASVTGGIVKSDSFYMSVYLGTEENGGWESMGYKYLTSTDTGRILKKTAFKSNNPSIFEGANTFKIELVRESDGKPEILLSKVLAYEAVEYKAAAEYAEIHANSLEIRCRSLVVIDSTTNNHAVLYLRENGSDSWEELAEVYLSAENAYALQASGLKYGTAYDVKIVHFDTGRVLYEASSAFTTGEDDRSILLTPVNSGATSIVIHYASESGYNVHEDNYLYFYYKRTDEAAYKLNCIVPAARDGIVEDFVTFSNLTSGKEYSILAELKEGKDEEHNSQGVGVSLGESVTIGTEANDYVLKATPREIGSFYADIDLELGKETGRALSYNHIILTLTPVKGTAGKVQYDLLLSGEEGNCETLHADGLMAGTEYKMSAVYVTPETRKNGETYLASRQKFDELGTFKTEDAEGAKNISFTCEKKIIYENGEKSIHVLTGSPFMLNATATPAETVNSIEWSSSNNKVATVDAKGNVTPLAAGNAAITASFMKDGVAYVSESIKIEVFHYGLCEVKDGRLSDIDPDTFQFVAGRKYELAVRDRELNIEDPDALIKGITWATDNPVAGTIDKDGVFTAKAYGKVHIYAYTLDDMEMDSGLLPVRNEIKGLTIGLESADAAFMPIRGEQEDSYTVAAGVDYNVNVYASAAFAESSENTCPIDAAEYTLSTDMGNYVRDGILYIPNSLLRFGRTKVLLTAKLNDGGKVVERTLTLYVVDKPETINLEQTYVWGHVSPKLKDAPLPDGFRWEEEDTPVDGIAGENDYTYNAYVSSRDFYPLSQPVKVHVWNKPVEVLDIGCEILNSGESYARPDTSIPVTLISPEAESLPYIEVSDLKCSSRNAKNIKIEKGEVQGTYQVKALKEGSYTLSVTCTFYEAKWDYDRLVRGKAVSTQTYSRNILIQENPPVKEILFFEVKDAADKENLIYSDNCLRYDIRSAEENKNKKERNIQVRISAIDLFSRDISKTAKLKITSSDTSVAAVSRDKKDPEYLNIKIKKNDGKAVITVHGADQNKAAAALTIDIRDYTPRLEQKKTVVLYKDNPRKGCDSSNKIADIILPFPEEQQIKALYLVKNAKAGIVADNLIKGISLTHLPSSVGEGIYVNVKESEAALLAAGKNMSCSLAVQTDYYQDVVYIPVKLTVEEKFPDVALKVDRPVNLFYYNTLNDLNDPDTCSNVSVILPKKAAGVTVEKVEWRPGVKAEQAPTAPSLRPKNNEFRIRRASEGKAASWVIDYCYPVLDYNHAPSADSVSGTLYVFLEGYQYPVKKDFTIPTVYKKPALKANAFRISPETGINYAEGKIYTDAYDSYKRCLSAENRDYSGLYFNNVLCSDKDVSAKVDGTDKSVVRLVYKGKESRDVTITFGADNWRETIGVKAKIKADKAKLKLSNPTLILNSAYPSNLYESYDETFLINASTGTEADFNHFEVAASGEAKRLLDDGIINMERIKDAGDPASKIRVSLNDSKALSSEVKPGKYKYQLTPSYAYGQKLPAVTLNVTVVSQAVSVSLKTAGRMNLLLLKTDDSEGAYDKGAAIRVTPKFSGISSSCTIQDVMLQGEYADYFAIYDKDSLDYAKDGVVYVIPKEKGKLKAGREYQLNVVYTLAEGRADNEKKITAKGKIKIKPVQVLPKVKTDAVTVYRSNISDTSVGVDIPEGYCISSMYGSLDVNGDQKADITIENKGYCTGRFSVPVQIEARDCALKATKGGVNYKVPVRVAFDGNDGTGGTGIVYVTVKIKK